MYNRSSADGLRYAIVRLEYNDPAMAMPLTNDIEMCVCVRVRCAFSAI